MSNETPPVEEKGRYRDFVIVRSYPETIYFYPSMIVAFLVWLTHVFEIATQGDSTAIALGTFFFVMFAFNFIIVAFDFGIGKTALIASLVIILTLVYFLVRSSFPELDPLHGFSLPVIEASKDFYFWFAILIFVHLLFVYVYSRIDYWQISPTDIYHHRGVLGDEKRFGNAQHAVIEKSSPDIFEKMLFLSGDIYIKPDREQHIFRISNVFNVNKKEEAIRDVLSYVPDRKMDL